MNRLSRTLIRLALVLTLGTSVQAQPAEPAVRLTVQAGTPLRLALDGRARIRVVGQRVTATLLEPLYACDRKVLPAGTKAIGHIASIERVTNGRRWRSLLAGDLTPTPGVMLEFDFLVSRDGSRISIHTSVTPGADRVVFRVADMPPHEGAASKAREEAARRMKGAVSVVAAPGKLDRLRDAAIAALPVRPAYLRKGTVYTATLLSPLDFGMASAVARAVPGTGPAPESILNARLTTPLSSNTTAVGAPVEAVLTQPVFAPGGGLILPAGTRLTGRVTLVRGARRFHRNGQLRFLFERVESDAREQRLLASLYSTESAGGDRLAIDDEGGTRMKSSGLRFVAPALGALALAASLHSRLDYDTDGAGPEKEYGGFGSSSVGGWAGLAGLGVGLAQLGRPVSLTLTVAGLARTTYSSVFGRGRNVSFPANTSIQVQLAPGPPRKDQ
jgi:hypothetical protein